MEKLRIKKGSEIRIIKGHPWIYSNEIENFASLKNLPKGELVEVIIKKDESFGLAYFNPHSLIAGRILSYNAAEKINEDFFVKRLLDAKKLREKFFDQPFYRLIHSEADFLPGLVIDRFGDFFVCQISTAGMENLSPFLISALEKVFSDAKIIFKNELDNRKYEGLENYTKIIKGEIPDQIELEENGIKFLANIKEGQKTGWFYDQRINRKFIGEISKDCNVLDAFCYLGGFGFNALKNGAKSVTFIDSSKEAIEACKNNSLANANCEFINQKVFEFFENAELQNQQFDVISLDPPAFIKSKKDFFSGLKGYEKLVKLALPFLKTGGILMLSSCSHNAALSDLLASANDALRKSNRLAKLIRTYGAAYDHPVHPALKESEYLKSITFLIE